MTTFLSPKITQNCVLSDNDVRMPWGEPEVLKESLKNGRIKRGHIEACAKRILEMILKLD